jgi:hypothetical protein
MIRNNNNNNSNTIEWQSVRNKKYKNQSQTKETSPNTTLERNENYVPKPIRESIDDILYSSVSTYEKVYELNKKVNNFVKHRQTNNDNINWKKRLNIYIIHKSCKQNRHEIIASIVDTVSDPTIYSNAISSTLSGNTCLFDAAYFGSELCMNYLINRGADIHHINKKNETIYDVIKIGRKSRIEENPNVSILLDDKYDECVRLIKQAEEQEKRKKEQLDEGKIQKDELDEKHTENELDEKHKENEFKEEYDHKTLKEDILKYIEEPAKFRKFVEYLKSNNFTDMLVKIFEDEDMEDILIDNPYVAKLI